MVKLTKALPIVPVGQVYPITLEAGSECPAWAEDVARQLGILETDKPKVAPKTKALKAAPESK